MVELTRLTKALAIAGLPISGTALYWLALALDMPPAMTAARVGMVCAEVSCAGVLMWSWGAVIAWVAKGWNWDEGGCSKAATLPFAALWFVLVVFGNSSRRFALANLLFISSIFAGYIATSMAFRKPDIP